MKSNSLEKAASANQPLKNQLTRVGVSGWLTVLPHRTCTEANSGPPLASNVTVWYSDLLYALAQSCTAWVCGP